MKTKTLFIITIGTVCLISKTAPATECQTNTCPDNVRTVGSTANCASGYTRGGECYYVTGYGATVRAYGCDKCAEGYTRKQVTEVFNTATCTLSFSPSQCIKNASSDDSNICNTYCASEDNWGKSPTNKNGGLYQSCTYSGKTVYRCWAGYYDVIGTGCSEKYGNTSTGYVYCSQCPKYTVNGANVYGTSPYGSASPTACYIESGTTGTDDTGTYIFTDKCDYKL